MSELRTTSTRPPVIFRHSTKEMKFRLLALSLTIGIAVILSGIVLASNSSPAYALDSNGCTMCHASPDIAIGPKSLTVSKDATETSAHRYLDCLDCHDPNDTGTNGVLSLTYLHAKEDPTETKPNALEMNKLSAAEFCGKCHDYQYKVYAESIHGKNVLIGYSSGASDEEKQAAQDSANCLDCHSQTSNAHNILRALDEDSSAYRKNIPATCSEECHDSAKVMDRYGIDSYVYDGYRKDFHGKAVTVDSYEVDDRMAATCADCHYNSHDIQSASTLTVQGTCGECHDVPAEDEHRMMETWMGHTEPSSSDFPVVFFVDWIYRILVPATLLFGSTHVILAFFKWVRNRGD